MGEVSSVSLTEDMGKLRIKKKDLVDQAKKLLLEYAETCETLKSEYEQKRCEAGADREYRYAAQARLIALKMPGQLLGQNIASMKDMRKECETLIETLKDVR